jgi:hypothetical protein
MCFVFFAELAEFLILYYLDHLWLQRINFRFLLDCVCRWKRSKVRMRHELFPNLLVTKNEVFVCPQSSFRPYFIIQVFYPFPSTAFASQYFPSFFGIHSITVEHISYVALLHTVLAVSFLFQQYHSPLYDFYLLVYYLNVDTNLSVT